MDQNTFHRVRIFTAIIVAGVCSVLVVQGNYVLPIIIGITAVTALYAAKKQVKGVLADERDYLVAGKAARWTLCIYTIAAAVGSLVLMALRQNRPDYELAAQILAYSACFLLIVQSLLLKFFLKKNNG
jgi:uncharacterized membrane protein